MAELPRYQMMGIPVPGMPQLDFAAQREQARLAGGISEGLSRISEFAFKEARKEAEIKGMQYGIQNPVTVEQLDSAMKEGKPVEQLFQQRGTSFGEAARAVQAKQLRSLLESMGRNDLVKLDEYVQGASQVNPADIEVRINGIIDGYAKVISGVDPEEGIRFRQSMAAVGSQAYRSAQKKVMNLHTQFIIGNYEESMRTLAADINLSLSEEDPNVVKKSIENAILQRSKLAFQTGKPEVITAFRKDSQEIILKTIADIALKPEFARNATEAIAKIEKGQSGNISELVKGVDKFDLREYIYKRQDQEKKGMDYALYQADKQADELEREFYHYNTSVSRRREIMDAVRKLPVDGTRVKAMRELYFSDNQYGPQRDDLDEFARLNSLAQAGLLTIDNVKNSSKITINTKKALITNITNPKDVHSVYRRNITLAAGFEGANLPLGQFDKTQAKNLVIQGRNEALLEFDQFVFSKNDDGSARTQEQIRKKGDELIQKTKNIYTNGIAIQNDNSFASMDIIISQLNSKITNKADKVSIDTTNINNPEHIQKIRDAIIKYAGKDKQQILGNFNGSYNRYISNIQKLKERQQ